MAVVVRPSTCDSDHPRKVRTQAGRSYHPAGMIWALLAVLGVPLWLIAIALAVLVYRNRALRTRQGDIPCRLQHRPGGRWTRGHGIWVHDVFSFRASPASWNDWLGWVREASLRSPDPVEAKKLRRLSDPIIATFLIDDGEIVSVAANGQDQTALVGQITLVSSIN